MKTIIFFLLLAGAFTVGNAQDTTNIKKDSTNKYYRTKADSIRLKNGKVTDTANARIRLADSVDSIINRVGDSVIVLTIADSTHALDSSNLVNPPVSDTLVNRTNTDSTVKPSLESIGVPAPGDSTHTMDNSNLVSPNVGDTSVNNLTTDSTANRSGISVPDSNSTVAPTVQGAINSNKALSNQTMDSSKMNMNSTRTAGSMMSADAVQNSLQKFAALPVLNTYIPDAVVSQLKSRYGNKLYDITMLKTGEQQYAYSVRTQENGIYKSELVGDNGTAINRQ